MTQQGDYQSAVKHYEQALWLDREYLLPYLEIANTHRLLGDLEMALAYQQELVALLDDQQITQLQKNQDSWYFPTDNGPVYFDALTEKRCYVYYSLSATLRLVGRTEAAATYAAKARALKVADKASIQALVALDLKQLQAQDRSLAPRIDKVEEPLLKGLSHG